MPVDAELPAEPLQPINGHFLKQTLGRLHARTQPPTDSIFELLQRDSTGKTLFMYQLHQSDG
ncbi:hypothetical protein DES53_102561 [Roseimicrobium gellanilyticum]|uniref:Uncharacterized protein n=1 Tax=Roseimicrobium gellanilyticum TaxID=748857 RepID=A0A366HR75_9BACT|nr:hypothetical protein DES53_102561 [Roseimicrobium gellanilyticum]